MEDWVQWVVSTVCSGVTIWLEADAALTSIIVKRRFGLQWRLTVARS